MLCLRRLHHRCGDARREELLLVEGDGRDSTDYDTKLCVCRCSSRALKKASSHECESLARLLQKCAPAFHPPSHPSCHVFFFFIYQPFFPASSSSFSSSSLCFIACCLLLYLSPHSPSLSSFLPFFLPFPDFRFFPAPLYSLICLFFSSSSPIISSPLSVSHSFALSLPSLLCFPPYLSLCLVHASL